jgi:hypothetical protein
MDREKLKRSLIALSKQQGHYGTLDIESVIDMIEPRVDLISMYQQRDIDESMEQRKRIRTLDKILDKAAKELF